MGLFSTIFQVNFLCALVPCEWNFNKPESYIKSEHYTHRRTLLGEPILKNEYPVVFTKYGGIRGYSMGTIHGNRIHAFEGIPYAAPPIGYLRFRAPIPTKSWKGIRNAFKPSKRCLQIHPSLVFRVVGDEDCLYLNIFTPNIPDVKPLEQRKRKSKIPVIVWFHGGSFIFGGGVEYGPAYITDQNVILVTVNYRLGVLGFLSTGDSASPGNYGLKDQALALKWVHENIDAFGGDPNKVTLMGQSAGAVSTHLHVVANKTRDYFRSAISLSGSAFMNWAVQTKSEAKFWTNWLAELIKCPTTQNTQALVECFRNTNPAFLVAYTIRLFRWLTFPPVLFAPVVEHENPDAFLTDTVENSYKLGKVAKKPWIATITSEEGYTALYFVEALQQLKYLRRNFKLFQSFVLDYDHLLNSSQVDVINHKIQEFYFGSESPETIPKENLARIITDRYFVNGHIISVKTHSYIAPTYTYYFNFKGRTNVGVVSGLKSEEWGVGHGEDVFYFFNSSYFYDGMIRNSQDFKLSQAMLNFVGNFAHKGVPYYTFTNGTDSTFWEAIKPDSEIKFLHLSGDKIQMINNPLTERIKFWESLKIPGVNFTVMK